MKMSIEKLIARSRDVHGKIDEERLRQTITEAFQNGEFGLQDMLLELVIRSEILNGIRSKIDSEQEYQEKLQCRRDDQLAELTKILLGIDDTSRKLVRGRSKIVSEVESAVSAIDYKKIGDSVADAVNHYGLEKVERLAYQIERTSARFAGLSERIIQRIWRTEKNFRLLKIGVFKYVCTVSSILALVLSLGVWLGISFVGKEISKGDILMPMVLQERNTRVEYIDGYTVAVVENVIRVQRNSTGNAVLVLESD
ncbi:hypothetical protein VDG1235_4237 [Verrucomicrobiia bacterium DG1235]|nr:hypothetical protein VDG1235_4237 [Verrucomicrobiae bacterium DG1235]